MGLRLGEGLRLEVGDIDGARYRIHIRNGKGGKDRYVPLPKVTLDILRRFWMTHRHPKLKWKKEKKWIREKENNQVSQ